MADLTRKEFYELAEKCREMALELARHEQDRVSVDQCRAFNEWLPRILAFDRLKRDLPGLSPARPLTRGRVMLVTVVVLLGLAFLLRDFLGRYTLFALTAALTTTGIGLVFLPERLYGTTVALIEGKVLRIVTLLEKILLSQELNLTEAAFFVAKENLAAAKHELRTQLHHAQRW